MDRNRRSDQKLITSPEVGARSKALNLHVIHSLKEAKRWSDVELAENAGIAKNTWTNIKNKGSASDAVIEGLAKAFGVAKQLLLVESDAPQPKPSSNLAKEQYKDMLRHVAHSDGYSQYASANEGLFDENFLSYVLANRRNELYFLNLSPHGKDEAHKELCTEGLLCYAVDSKTSQPVFRIRRWTQRECLDNLMLRAGTEIIAAKRAISLLADPSGREEFVYIKEALACYLKEMGKHMPGVEKDESLAKVAMIHDGNFHKAWAGFASNFREALGVTIASHGQIVNYYLSQIKDIRQRLPLLANELPSFGSITRSSFEDLSEIYDLFDDIKNPREEAKIEKLVKAIEAHPKKNFEKFQEAKKRIESAAA